MISKEKLKQLQQSQDESFLNYESDEFKRIYYYLKDQLNRNVIHMAKTSRVEMSLFSNLKGRMYFGFDKAVVSRSMLKLKSIFKQEGYEISNIECRFENNRIKKCLVVDYTIKINHNILFDRNHIKNTLNDTSKKEHTNELYNSNEILPADSFDALYLYFLDANISAEIKNLSEQLDQQLIEHFVYHKRQDRMFFVPSFKRGVGEVFKEHVLNELLKIAKDNNYKTKIEGFEPQLSISIQ